MQLERYTKIVGNFMQRSHWSGLTDVRTVSDELSDSDVSDCFSFATDQTLHITEVDKQDRRRFDPMTVMKREPNKFKRFINVLLQNVKEAFEKVEQEKRLIEDEVSDVLTFVDKVEMIMRERADGLKV